MPGQAHLGPYTLEQPIGRGGFATVWAARHRTLGTLHAVKVLDAVTPNRRQRLEREGRLQSRMDPRHVVPVTEVVLDGARVALVMPLVQGCTLADLLDVHEPDLTEALALFRGLLDGVQVAHDAGVVHRDLKPANVLLDVHQGRLRIRIADFGIATTADEADSTGFSGTPAYASPEQHAGDALDARSDLWALGAILVELLTGERAADGARPAAASPVASLCDALLQARPQDRPADVAAVRRALDSLLDDPSVLFVGRPLATALRAVERSRTVDDPRVPTAAPTLVTWTDEAHALPPHSLPGPAADLLAVDAPRARVVDHLRSEHASTWIVGPAGVGKSALALDIAWSQLRERPGGTTWVALTDDVHDQTDVVQVLSAGLEVAGPGTDPQVLQVALAARARCLVVLDGAEHAVQTVSDLIDALHPHAPDARFLVTSRVAPDAAATVILEPLSVDDAARLLVQLHATPLDLDQARQHVQRIDRLPLAIELLAGLDVLPAPGADIGLDLDASVAGSWAPLAPWQQQALAHLAAFEGPFDLEAATAVLRLPPDAPAPLDVLEALVRRSLLRPAGEGWFVLLSSVRNLAATHAADPQADRLAVATYLAGFGTPQAIVDLRGPGGPVRQRALARHRDDLIQACRRTQARLPPDLAIALALACWAVLDVQGPLAQGPEILEPVRARDDLSTPQQARLDLALFQALTLLNRLPQAEIVQRRVLDALPHLDDPLLRAEVHLRVAQAAQRRMDEAGVQSATERALQASHDPQVRSRAALIRGSSAAVAGRPDQAIDLLSEAAALSVQSGDRAGEGMARKNLANVLSELDRVDEALAEYLQALQALGETGKRRERAIAQANLGLLHRQRGDLEQAARTLDAARQEHLAIGNLRSAALALGYRGNTLQLMGRLDDAKASYAAAEQALLELGSTVLAADARGHHGRLLAAQGDLEGARALLTSALAHHDHGVYPAAAATWLRELAELAARCGEPWHDLIERAYQAGGATPLGRVNTWAVRAELRLLDGDVAGARADVHAALAEHPQALERADLRRVDALVAHAEGYPQAAQDALAEALDLTQAAGLGHDAMLMQRIRRAQDLVTPRPSPETL